MMFAKLEPKMELVILKLSVLKEMEKNQVAVPVDLEFVVSVSNQKILTFRIIFKKLNYKKNLRAYNYLVKISLFVHSYYGLRSKHH